jgi:hypothetical protein
VSRGPERLNFPDRGRDEPWTPTIKNMINASHLAASPRRHPGEQVRTCPNLLARVDPNTEKSTSRVGALVALGHALGTYQNSTTNGPGYATIKGEQHQRRSQVEQVI